MEKQKGEVRVPIDREQYAELSELKSITKIPLQELVKEGLDWWLDTRAPTLRQNAEATFSRRRK
jgi:hypothetical protein